MKLFSAIIAAAVSLDFANSTSCATLEANIKASIDFHHEFFGLHDISAVDRYYGDYYYEHNPVVADGHEAFKAFGRLLTNATTFEAGAVIAVGDYVWLNSRYTNIPGAPPAVVTVDVVRFEKGKIVEHWDVVQAEVPADKTVSGRPMFPIKGLVPTLPSRSACGETECDATTPTLEANKKAAKTLLSDLVNKKDLSSVDKYVGEVYMEHNPAAPDGRAGFKGFVDSLASNSSVEFGPVIAAGDLVWLNTRYVGIPGFKVALALDVFRFEKGKIVEHWDIIQEEVPVAETASKRPMFPFHG